MPTESPRVNHPIPPIFDPSPLAVPSVQPISARTRSRTAKNSATQPRARDKKNIAPPASGPAFNTRSAIRSASTSQLEQALAIACSLQPATNQAQKLSQRNFPRAMFAAALAAISPEAKLDPRVAALAVMDLESGKELKYRELLKHPKLGEIWNGSSSNEFDRFAQGKTGRVKGTDTIDFIHYDEIP